MAFQSLSGFFRPCNSAYRVGTYHFLKLFQSLSGFFRPCNRYFGTGSVNPMRSFNPCRVFSGLATMGRELPGSHVDKFQSLSGFFRPCNVAERCDVETRIF